MSAEKPLPSAGACPTPAGSSTAASTPAAVAPAAAAEQGQGVIVLRRGNSTHFLR